MTDIGLDLHTSASGVFSVAEEAGHYTTSASSVSPAEPSTHGDAIAVIGYGCRVPGGNNSPSQLWDFLLSKGDASGNIPEMRWEPYNTRQPGNAEILSKTTSKGYFLDNLEDFDASFFGISPREAEQIDPQQRIALEVAWEALEHAGIPPQSLSGSDTAVFMGVNSDDYSRLLLEDLPNIEAWMGVGTAFCGIPNRISYLLNLMGPSTAVDAACASSLVAIHHGRQALISKETSLVIAGGVNALIGPGLPRVLDNAGAISADGRCRSFDDSAAGYGRGEGAGIVILKRLEDAIEDEDRVLAVLKGSAVGADGRTNGIMAPNQHAQERVAWQALREAKISADTISYIEAHATSTPIGDPTECAAMATVYGSGARHPKSGSEPCYIGSIKPNIGHLEAGAGVMGFIKAIMAIQTGVIPPQANLTTPNTKIDWEKSMLKPVTESTPWPNNGQPRRAAIASYGYGGTVSHAIIEAPQFTQALSLRRLLPSSSATKDPTILLLSGPQAARVKKAAASLAYWLQQPKSAQSEVADLDSVAYTLAVKRGHHKFRTAIVAEGRTEAIELLNLVAQNRQNAQIFSGRTLTKDDGKGTVWVYSGHGAQWEAMGQTIIDEERAFADVLAQIEPIVQEQMGFSATAALRSGKFDSVDKVQILTYVMQVGLTAVLTSRGARPQAVIGHSLGEIAASVVAGALTLAEGALVCCIRARMYRDLASAGAMIMVSIPFKAATKELELRNDAVAAIDSSPNSCVVSGTVETINELSAKWKQDGHKVYVVKTDVAFHSPLLVPLVDPLRKALGNMISPRPPRIMLYSTCSSDPREAIPRDNEYWINNMIKPVLLTSAITAAANDGHKVFLEISSHPIVSHSINETLMDSGITDGIVFPTLLRNKSTRKSMLLALSRLHCIGDTIAFKRFLPGNWLHDVPGTIWEHQPYWRTVSTPVTGRNVSHDVNAHNLLGGRTQINRTDSVLWQTYLDSQVKPFPGFHPLHGTEIVPAAVLMNTFLSAVPGYSLRHVSLRVPVVVGPPREVQVLLEKNQISISSRLTESGSAAGDNHSWVLNTHTHISPADNLSVAQKADLFEIKQRLPTRLSDSFSIDYLATVGVSEMGFPWKVLDHRESDNEMLAKVHADPDADSSKHWNGTSWASILDAATSISSTIFYKQPLLRMPTEIESVTLLAERLTPQICYIYVKKAAGDYAADVLIFDEEGKVVVNIHGLRFAGIDGNAAAWKSDKGLVHRIAWPPAQLSENPLRFRKVVFISKECPLLDSYRARLSSTGYDHATVAEVEGMTDVEEDSIIVFMPEGAKKPEDIFTSSAKSCEDLLAAVKFLTSSSLCNKVFCITQNVSKGADSRSLSQAPLLGLARILQSEEPKVFGGLIDVEDDVFPMVAIKYVQGVDVIRIDDSVARNARLRPFDQELAPVVGDQPSFHLRAQGTYLITGGLGALGLEVATYLAEKDAKRLVLVSRRRLPPRHLWSNQKGNMEIQRVLSLEAMGVSVYIVSVDMTAANASTQLRSALDAISLPPVLGVIHAAGTLANQIITETTSEAFNSVIAPKIAGAMALHECFAPKTLDFMVLFSSCGQLLGFPGQASYASGNAFLDTLATHRRNKGDNTVSMMWTSWRGLGMAASTKYIDAELSARGITDITKEEAFIAWEQTFKHDTDHSVILTTLPLDADEPSPHPVLDDIIVRRRTITTKTSANEDAQHTEPTGGPELQAYLAKKVTSCVASTLSLAEDSIDPNVALSELGMDSVMSVQLRTQLQQTMKVKVQPTLIWNCPTVGHLVQHFFKEKSN
jgi:6-methylsalicylic acid synthase